MEEKYSLADALMDEFNVLSQEERHVEEQAKEIQVRLETIRRRKDLIKALAEASGYAFSVGQLPSTNTAIESDKDGQHTSVTANGRSVADIAYEILLGLGRKTMHYEELTRLVIANGGKLGGETPSQTLIARIARDPRFVRPEKRGWYGARDHFKSAKSVGARKSTGSHTKMRGKK